ncbi:hypothetical protein VTL71DRAFT_12389, partial [Oculimacula yallundae]
MAGWLLPEYSHPRAYVRKWTFTLGSPRPGWSYLHAFITNKLFLRRSIPKRLNLQDLPSSHNSVNTYVFSRSFEAPQSYAFQNVLTEP